MKKRNTVDLRNQWESFSTQELEAMLQEELVQNPPDDEKVISLLHILEAREKDIPLHLSEKEAEAWAQYRQKVMGRQGKRRMPPRWLSVAASAVLILAVLFSVVPQQVQAESFWEMLQRVKSSIMEYISPRERLFDAESEYVFQTDNPGLQQVYDAVVALGVTEPVVPMWLPADYELKEFVHLDSPMTKGIHGSFSNGQNELVYRITVYSGEPAHQYYKDDTHYESHEREGTLFHITRNNEWWFVIWTNENIECVLTLDCTEDTLWKILESIHVTEAD